MFRLWKRNRVQGRSRTAGARPRTTRPRVEMLEDRTLLSVALVSDLNGIASSSRPSGFVTLGNRAYFFADDGQDGVELWQTDGTAANTRLVKDINPGSASGGLASSPSPVVLGSALYFFADSGANGIQLWKSDGTAGGTVPLSGTAPGSPAYANQVAADSAKGLAFFVDPASGQLWQTDGTAADTAAVKDGSGNPVDFAFDPTAVGNTGTVFFSGQQSGSSGTQAGLWKTDGTAGGASLIAAVPGSISDLTDVNGTAYFVVTTAGANGQKDAALWTSNGTAAGTRMVHDFGSVAVAAPSPVSDLTAFNGKLYFAADDHNASPDLGTQLWVSDGTAGGTHAVAGAGSGLGASPDLTVFSNSLYFLAAGTSGQGLWKLDGTSGSVAQVLDGSNQPVTATAVLSAVNGSLYFAGSGAAGPGLWQTNGSGATFVQSTVISASLPGSSAAVNGRLVFPANDGFHGVQLWASDGSTAGTAMLAAINPGIGPAASSEPQAITDVNGTAFFLADDGSHGVQLWKSDGTAGGTQMVTDFSGTAGGSAFAGPPRLLNVNGTLYFFASDGNPADGAVQLWKSDGTAAGTTLVQGFTPRQDGPFGYLDGLPDTLTAVGDKVFFAADDGVHGLTLWQSDGTAAGTGMVPGVGTGPGGSDPADLTAVGNLLYFTANDGSRSGLWQTDGATTTFLQAGASNLVNVSGTLYFTAPDVHGVPALWKTTGGTPVEVASLGQGSSARLPTAVGSTLYLVVDGAGTEALWASTGTGASAVAGIPGGSTLSELTAAGSTLYFIDNAGGTQLWKSSGASAAEVAPVTSLSGSFGLTNVGGALVFAADDPTRGQEVWTSNGTAGGTALLQDIATGPAGSFPHDFASVGGQLFLAANDGVHGVELFGPGSASRAPTGTNLTVSATSVTAGQSVTFTAFVQSTQGTVDGGSITFFDGSSSLGTVPVSGGGASLSAALGVGSHSVTAMYSGDVSFTGSTSQAVGVTVAATGSAATTTRLSASSSSVPAGQFVTFTATVKPSQGGNLDGGQVDFKDGPNDLGVVAVNPNGVATLSAALAQGQHSVTAVYLGDAGFAGSTSNSVGVTVTVPTQTATTTYLTASATSVQAGQAVTLTATVAPNQGGTVDGGAVDFRDGQVDLGSQNVNAMGSASVMMVLPAGVHDVTAVYSGDAHFGGSVSGGVTVTVAQASGTAATSTVLEVSPTTAASGTPVALTATVSSGQGVVSDGTVDFILDDQTDLGSAPVGSNGQAALNPSPTLPVGPHHVTAVYSGDASFAASTSSLVDVTVTPTGAAATTTTLSASASQVTPGQSVEFTATVKPSGQPGNVDGGWVDFTDGGQDLGQRPVDTTNGTAVLDVTLAPGPHNVTATYSGDASYAGSPSSPVPVTVQSPTTTFLTASATNVNAGDPVTFTASVTTAGSSPHPVDGGQVLFLDGGVLFASASVNGQTGTAQLTTFLGSGPHHITAVYQGDVPYAGSGSSGVDVAVTPPPFYGDATPAFVPIVMPMPSHGSHAVSVAETLLLWNFGGAPLAGPIYVVLHGLHAGVTLRGAAGYVRHGRTRYPYVIVTPLAGVVGPFDMMFVPLQFSGRPGSFTITVSAGIPPA